MKPLLWPSLLATVMLAALTLSGCGGGGDGAGPPVVATGTVSGRVVQADNVAAGIANAEVTLVTTGTAGLDAAQALTARTDSQGNYTLTGVPVGQQTIIASRSSDAVYRSQTVPGVPVLANQTTRLNIALLRQDQPEPTSIRLSPASVVVDLNGQAKFSGVVDGGSGTPTYVIVGDIGRISPNGLFTGTQVGVGQLKAYAGSASATAEIEVVGPRPPEVSSLLLSPTEFASGGGTLTITAAINDGDGIASAVAEIYAPAQDVTRLDMTLTAGNAKDGTYRVSFDVPANSNVPDSSGVQAPMNYSVRVVATDGSGATGTSAFVDLTVAGVRPPPPPI